MLRVDHKLLFKGELIFFIDYMANKTKTSRKKLAISLRNLNFSCKRKMSQYLDAPRCCVLRHRVDLRAISISRNISLAFFKKNFKKNCKVIFNVKVTNKIYFNGFVKKTVQEGRVYRD